MAYTTIKKPSDYFNTKLYTGNGGTNATTGVGFQPDWIWIKRRDVSAWHYLFDSIRGANKTLYSNLTSAETTDTNNLQSFDSDGFTVGTQADMNQSGGTFVSWNWLASNTTASNTDGSITSTVSANTTSGFSIVSYTGTGSAGTVGHGLGAVPKMIIIKNRSDGSGHWRVYHASIGNTKYLDLDNNGAENTSSTTFNNTTPTNSVFSIGSDSRANGSGNAMIAYCFADVQGFSKFGSYVGNGNADGTFVYTGFKPAFVIQKNSSAVQGWQLQDNKRLGYNPNNYLLQPHDSAAESALQRIDLLSNGFKVRTTDAGQNASGNTYIYMAFAEEPLVGDNPATAR